MYPSKNMLRFDGKNMAHFRLARGNLQRNGRQHNALVAILSVLVHPLSNSLLQ